MAKNSHNISMISTKKIPGIFHKKLKAIFFNNGEIFFSKLYLGFIRLQDILLMTRHDA